MNFMFVFYFITLGGDLQPIFRKIRGCSIQPRQEVRRRSEFFLNFKRRCRCHSSTCFTFKCHFKVKRS